MKSPVRKISLAFLALLIVVAAAVIGVRFVLTSSSDAASTLRDYVARQVVGIVNSHLEPTLDFDTVELELPGTVRFTGARLTSPDGTRVLDLDHLLITLDEVPRVDKPIRIARVEINGGAVNLIQDAATGQFKGLQPLVKRGVRSGAAAVADESRLSTVLRLEHITISGLNLSYSDGSGSPPMVISGFGVDLAIEPATDEGEGWYALRADAGRSPGLTLDLDGSFNIDSFVANLGRAVCTIDLNETTTGSLPPQLQELVRGMDATGRAVVTIAGMLPLMEPLTADLRADLELTGVNIAAGDLRLPIASFKSRIDLADGRATTQDAVAELMNGTATISASASLLDSGSPASATWVIADVSLREALRSGVPEGETPKLAGQLSGSGRIDTTLAEPLGGISGAGEVHVRDGRLFVLPGMAELLQQVGQAATTGGAAFNHRGDATFTLEPAGVRITESEVVTGVLAARATGVIGYDGTLDMIVNAGPLERLQNALGAVGDLFGRLTDRLVKYRLRGTLDAPTVTVMPLGVGG